VAAYLRLFPRARVRVFATVLLIAFTGVAATLGLRPLLYAAALLAMGAWGASRRAIPRLRES
jgi:hypothetical protein